MEMRIFKHTTGRQASNADVTNATTSNCQSHGVETVVDINPAIARAHRGRLLVGGDVDVLHGAEVNHEAIVRRRQSRRRGVSAAAHGKRTRQVKDIQGIGGRDSQGDIEGAGGGDDTGGHDLPILRRPVGAHRGVILGRARLHDLVAQDELQEEAL